MVSRLHWFAARYGLSSCLPPDGSDREFRPANGDFYSRASDESVALFVVGYNQKNLNHAARIELALSYDHITTTMDR
jgi:hypothetical protein